jgi:hypothetical protein
MRTRTLCIIATLVGAATVSRADITYDAARRTITVTGFSQGSPGTLQDVLRKSDEQNWGVVAYDEATQTFTLNTSLVIGSDDGTSTWFRIGTPEHPREALVLQGDLKVAEPKKGAGYRQYTAHNVLWIGDEANEQIAPTVRFNCQKDGQYGFFVPDGNVLRISHATLGGASQDRQRLARCDVKCADAHTTDSTIEWVGGWGMLHSFNSLEWFGPGLKRVTFQHGGIAIANGTHWLEDCVFRDCDVGIYDWGCIDATLVRCRFEGNKRNWDLYPTPYGIVAIDCTVGPEREPGPHLRRRQYAAGRWNHPWFIAKRHIVVKVTDEAGKPVPGALVTLTESNGKVEGIEHGVAKTDANGKTPAPFEYGALLVLDYGYRATDDAASTDSPDCRIASYDYRYTLTIAADGYREAVVKEVDPDQSWVEKTVVLKAR